MNTKKNISVGIWGFGAMGKSAFNYFDKQNYHINIMDCRYPTFDEQITTNKKNVTWFNQITGQETFFNFSDFVIPSPGINIVESCYATNMQKLSCELDFFSHAFSKPIIAITGSIGKTSITTILDQVFKKLSIPVITGGNIGTPTFDLIHARDAVDFALLEVSSFQLMHCKRFAPFLSVWTNFYPNHLDHHETEANYFLAKSTILKYQKNNSLSLIPWTLRGAVPAPQTSHMRGYFFCDFPTVSSENHLRKNEIVYYIDKNVVMKYSDKIHIPLLPLTSSLLELTFAENILILAGACDLLHIDMRVLYDITLHLEHRIEHIATVNNVTFYNDSKGTTTASTQAAIEKLCHQPLHLFLGGLSKGVDRSLFVSQLRNKVKHIYCFGKEAEQLYAMCINNNIIATQHTDLESAVDVCIKLIKPGDCVLLSPAGSSYDLYDNYEQRGNHFKKLIEDHIKRYGS